MYYKKNVDYVELLWEDITYQIDNRGYKKQDKMYYPRFTKVIIHHFLTKDKTLSKRKKIGMHTSRDDYLINTLRFMSAKEESQINGARLPKSMTSHDMRESKAYKTYLAMIHELYLQRRVKRLAKKSTNAPTGGIDSLSEVALTEEAQYEEVRKKSLRDFHKTHPSGSGIATKIFPSGAKIKPCVTNKGTGAKLGVPDVTEEESSSDRESDSGDENTQSDNKKGSDFEHETDENEMCSKSNQEENEEENEEEKDDEFVKTSSISIDDEDETSDESKFEEKLKEGNDAEMINLQQRNENPEIILNQVIEDAHVTLSTVTKKTEVPVTSSSHSSDLASKFLNFSDIPYTDAKIISPMDVHVHREVPSIQPPILLTVPASVITESSPTSTTVIPQSLPSFTPPPQQSTPTPPPTTEATNHEDSNFSPLMIKRMVTESLEHAVLAMVSSQPKSTYEAAASLTEFKLKKILTDKMDESQSYLIVAEHKEFYDGLIKSYDLDKSIFSTYDKVYSLKRSQKEKDKDEDPSAGSDRGLKKRMTRKDAKSTLGLKTKELASGSSKGAKSQSKSFRKSVQSEELEFKVVDFDMPQDQEENMGNDDEEPKRQVASRSDWFTKPKQPEDHTDPDWNTFHGYARGLESTHDVYSTKRILAVTRVEVMRKHGYGYLREIELQRADNNLYTFKEGDFPIRHINDIEDMLIIIVQNRVKDLQLGFESCQKKINVTKPHTTRPDIRKKDTYTPYQDPQGFIYIDTQRRNRLMRSDKLYKFSNGTSTRLPTSLDDITKNIRMEYLPQRRWSSLEKKRAHIMIMAIDKQLKERRMMMSFEKFVCGRHYGTNLWLFQRTI
nr:hypothetical protein [Tanacetum cinerariifolium]